MIPCEMLVRSDNTCANIGIEKVVDRELLLAFNAFVAATFHYLLVFFLRKLFSPIFKFCVMKTKTDCKGWDND